MYNEKTEAYRKETIAKFTLIRNHKDSNPPLAIFTASAFNSDAILLKVGLTGH